MKAYTASELQKIVNIAYYRGYHDSTRALKPDPPDLDKVTTHPYQEVRRSPATQPGSESSTPAPSPPDPANPKSLPDPS